MSLNNSKIIILKRKLKTHMKLKIIIKKILIHHVKLLKTLEIAKTQSKTETFKGKLTTTVENLIVHHRFSAKICRKHFQLTRKPQKCHQFHKKDLGNFHCSKPILSVRFSQFNQESIEPSEFQET